MTKLPPAHDVNNYPEQLRQQYAQQRWEEINKALSADPTTPIAESISFPELLELVNKHVAC